MKNYLKPSILCLLILGLFSCQNGDQFTIDGEKFELNKGTIERTDITDVEDLYSYEIELSNDESFKGIVNLTLHIDNGDGLSEGTYDYDQSLIPYTLNSGDITTFGATFSNEYTITGGSADIKIHDEETEIEFDLKAEDGTGFEETITGNFRGVLR